MAQLDTQILPLLPLTSGVVSCPGMVVTLTIESDEARRAIAASESSDGELLLVPRIGSSTRRSAPLPRWRTWAGSAAASKPS